MNSLQSICKQNNNKKSAVIVEDHSCLRWDYQLELKKAKKEILRGKKKKIEESNGHRDLCKLLHISGNLEGHAHIQERYKKTLNSYLWLILRFLSEQKMMPKIMLKV